MKKVIYTVLLGKYDELKPAPNFPGWDTVLFTDVHYPNTKGWIVHKVQPVQDGARESRKYKFLSHKYLKGYDLVCHIDANMNLHREPPSTATWFTHPARKDVKTEAKRCLQLKKAPAQEIEVQLQAYNTAGFPDNVGLYQNGFFVRAHTPEQNKLMEATLQVVQTHSYRDQLALPYAIWSTGIYPENILKNNEWLKYITISNHIKKPQAQQARKQVAVHHITPGRADKNLGLSINTIIQGLPEQDWICLRDIDTIPAYHTVFFKQCEDIAAQSNFHLVSCVTNRLGLKYQLHGGEFSENFDMKHHLQIGKERYQQYGSQVQETNQTIAGILMLFPKSTWTRVGGFKEGGIQIQGAMLDYHFCCDVKNKGLRIGIANGIYLYHHYRMESNNPRRAIQHLLN